MKSLKFSRQCEHFCGRIAYANKRDVTKLPSVPSKLSIVLVQDPPLMLYIGRKIELLYS